MNAITQTLQVLQAVCEGNFDKPGRPSFTDAHAALEAIRALATQGEAKAEGGSVEPARFSLTVKDGDWTGTYEEWKTRHNVRAPSPQLVANIPRRCDGKEQEAFETWASANGYDMGVHPLHWLFHNDRTYAARQGWAAALAYVNEQVVAPQPVADGFYLASFKQKGAGYPGVLWWMPNNRGYTPDLAQAGVYTEITPGYHDSSHTVPVPVSFIASLRVRQIVDPDDELNAAFSSPEQLRAALAAAKEKANGL